MPKLLISSILSKNNLVCLSSLLFSTSIICPLASCGSDGSTNDIGGFDKEFGFDVQTYNRLENEFKNKYFNKLLNNNSIDKEVAFDKYNNFLQNDISIIRNQLFNPAQNYSFTIRTNVLLDYAAKNYNIYLNRDSNVSEKDFDNLKQSAVENFTIYLDSVYGIADVDKANKINDFTNSFDDLLNDINTEPKDKAQVLMELRAGIINCWANLNQEFAYLATYNHLKDFFDDYQFVVRDQSKKQTDDNELLWDKLLNNKDFITKEKKVGLINQDINCPIADQWINKLFTISEKKTVNEDTSSTQENNSSNQQDDSTSDTLDGYKQIENFDSQKIIPGYTFTPVLKSMTEDIYANEYHMKIDWQLISNKYKDEPSQEIKDKVTAHLAHKFDGTNSNNEKQFSSSDYDFVEYQLLSTPSYQRNNLIKAYFPGDEQGQNIVFSWDKEKTSLEDFLPSDTSYKDTEPIIIKDQYDLSMDQTNLSNAYLKVNDKLLSQLLEGEDEQSHITDNTTLDDNTNDNKDPTNKNNDSTLSIEQKFVLNCKIVNATSNVIFYNNDNDKDTDQLHDNKITTAFTIKYKNNDQIKFDNVASNAEITNIKLSNDFCEKAVGYYKDINDFTDSQKIEDSAEIAAIHSSVVTVYLFIMIVLLVVTLAVIMLTPKSQFQELPQEQNITNRLNNSISISSLTQPIKNHPWITFAILFGIAAILLLAWSFTIERPVKEHAENISKWNKALKNDDTNGNLHVLEKIKEDKEYFASSSNFKKYFDTNRSQAYASYWYYLHFKNVKNDKTNGKIKQQVIDDYNAFCNKRKEYAEKSDKEILLVFFHVVFILAIILMVIICVIFAYTLFANDNKTIKDASQNIEQNDLLEKIDNENNEHTQNQEQNINEKDPNTESKENQPKVKEKKTKLEILKEEYDKAKEDTKKVRQKYLNDEVSNDEYNNSCNNLKKKCKEYQDELSKDIFISNLDNLIPPNDDNDSEGLIED